MFEKRSSQRHSVTGEPLRTPANEVLFPTVFTTEQFLRSSVAPSLWDSEGPEIPWLRAVSRGHTKAAAPYQAASVSCSLMASASREHRRRRIVLAHRTNEMLVSTTTSLTRDRIRSASRGERMSLTRRLSYPR